MIRAEARVREGDLSDATSDLNAVRNRAGLGPTPAATQSDLLQAIMRERRMELFTEYGHRWLDLKRLGEVDSVMNSTTTLKGGTWSTDAQWFPIPYKDTQTDPNIRQNAGYQ